MIGVFICFCGQNIGGYINVPELTDYFNNWRDDVVAFNTTFLCSEIGQDLIKDKIEELNLEAVVIASCSPKHHGGIFQACIGQKMNQYRWEFANIREQCAWVTPNKKNATEKAKAIIAGAVEKARLLQDIGSTRVPVTKDVLVIGGGIAGMHGSLELTDKGFHVHMVEKQETIGGHMVQFDRVFPTDDCAMCTSSPILADVAMDPLIDIYSLSEVIEVRGRPGEYIVKIRRNPRYVDESKCTACGDCTTHCPVEAWSEWRYGMAVRSAIDKPLAQAVPLKNRIYNDTCIRCGTCENVCKADAVLYNQEPEEFEITVGAIMISTGYDILDLSNTEYHQEHPNVISHLQLEALKVPSGPTAGEILRPSDGKMPKHLVFVLCAGSRDRRHNVYCSKVCCMYTTKNARLIKAENPNMKITICYIDVRAAGRGYEEYFDKAREMGINYVRGNVSEIVPNGEDLIVRLEDTFTSEPLELDADLVVLSSGMVPSQGTRDMSEVIHVVSGADKFLAPVHVKIAPVDTANTGVYIAGTVEAPKPIQESITDAGLVASRIATFLKDPEIEIDLKTSKINADVCIKCGTCADNCVYDAIDTTGEDFKVLDVSCQACGKCSVICPTGAIDLQLYTEDQLIKQVDGILEQDPDSIIGYCCYQCGYNAADLAGTAKAFINPKVKVVLVPCSGRVTIQHMLYPFFKGAKGVFLAACLEGQCHYIDGNLQAKEKVKLAKKSLDLMGVGGRKLNLFNMSSAEGPKFVAAAKRMVEICQ
ncbi:MAG TPA: hydrogenase iron-sulfur subunit [Candidatus Methanofastidiosa archaeon]|nr:hydrogenase iron-sulfur subunit [Candidatus Methanofastidiosa archaeon]